MKAKSPWIEVVAVVVVTTVTAVLAIHFELHEVFSAFARRWEGLQVDELPVVLLVLSAGLIWLSWRRFRHANRELVARRAAEARLSAVLAENRELAQERLRIQEGERRSLARELHDELGQYLNAIKLDAVAVLAPDATHAQTQAAGRQIVQSVDHVHAAVSDMIRRLRPAGLDELGLTAALEACLDAWRRRLPQVRFVLRLGGELDGLGETLNLAVYRLVQEGLTNAFKHSGADRVEVQVERRVDAGGSPQIALRIADDGQGADPGALGKGFGIGGMRERVELLGGALTVTTGPGEGFAIGAMLPAT